MGIGCRGAGDVLGRITVGSATSASGVVLVTTPSTSSLWVVLEPLTSGMAGTDSTFLVVPQ